MRCKYCDITLNDKESRRRDRETGDFLDLCNECLTVSNETINDFYEYPVVGENIEEDID